MTKEGTTAKLLFSDRRELRPLFHPHAAVAIGALLLAALLPPEFCLAGSVGPFPSTPELSTEAAEAGGSLTHTYMDLLEEAARRRLDSVGRHGGDTPPAGDDEAGGFARILQQQDVCATEARAKDSCLLANVGNLSSPPLQNCSDCYRAKFALALDTFVHSPQDVGCSALNGMWCKPVAECACLEPCDNEISGYLDCAVRYAYTQGDPNLVFNCTISCAGTNVTINDDLVNSTDDFVGGLCIGEEAKVKICLESFGSTVASCYQCLQAGGKINVTETTTCGEVQADMCSDIARCPCMKDCSKEFAELRTCYVFYFASGLPLLQDCVQSGSACPNSTSAAFARSPRNSAAGAFRTIVGTSLFFLYALVEH
jgi:hypothetical protein